MNPKDYKYTKTHEWVKMEGDTAVVGITDFAQEQLGDITFVELPEANAEVAEGREMGSIESVKAASDLYSPVTGIVLSVNADLESAPELVNQDPYGKGWLIKIRVTAQPTTLLTAEEYEAVAAEGH